MSSSDNRAADSDHAPHATVSGHFEPSHAKRGGGAQAPPLDLEIYREEMATSLASTDGDAWVLRKGDKVARCSLLTHPLGWELRLITTDLLRSQVCRSVDEILQAREEWKTAMVERGWEPSIPER